MKCQRQRMRPAFVAYGDGDWANCRDTQRSTTGRCVKICTRCINNWSKMQSLVALSPGESELHAPLKATTDASGLLPILNDLGWLFHGEIWGDANAALRTVNWSGFGKARHIDTRLPWIQHVSAEQRFKFKKAVGTNNPTDLFTT